MSSRWKRPVRVGIPVAIVLAGLTLTLLHSALLFHTVAEVFSVAVMFGIFMLAYNARRFMRNHFLLLVGAGYGFVGVVTMLHMVAYKNMGVFAGDTSNLATQLWMARGFLMAGTLLTASLALGRRIRRPLWVIAAFAVITAGLLVSVFRPTGWWFPDFPDCYVPGDKPPLTTFKVVGEYVICGVLLLSLALVWRRRERLDRTVFRLIAAAIAVTALSEFAFTRYESVFGPANIIGHVLEVASFYLLYEALIATGLRRPYELLFRDLKRSEEALRQSEQRYRSLVELAPLGILVQRDGRVLYANPAAARLIGETGVEQFIGTNVERWVHPDDLAATRRRAEELIASGGALPPLEVRLLRSDGSETEAEVVSARVPYGEQSAVLSVVMDISAAREAQRTEDRLRRKSEAQRLWLRGVIENVPSGLCVLDGSDLCVKWANRTFAVMAGSDPESCAAGREFSECCSQADEIGLTQRLRRAAAEGTPIIDEELTVPGDGEERHWRCAIQPLGEPDGDGGGDLMLVVTDVTDQVRARRQLERQLEEGEAELQATAEDLHGEVRQRMRVERALHATEQYRRAVVASAPVAILATDTDGRITLAEGAGLTALRHAPDELIGRRLVDVHGHLPNVAEGLAGALGGRGATVEMEAGTGHILETRFSPLTDDDGNVSGVIWVSTDITRRKRAEQALRQSEEQFRTLVEHIPAVTYIAGLDEEFTPIYVSPKIRDLMGYDAQEFLRQPSLWRESLDPEDESRVQAAGLQAMRTGEPVVCEYRLRHRNGDVLWVHDEAVLVRDEHDRPAFFQGVMMDITDRRRAAEAAENERRRLFAVLNMLPGYVLLLDGDHRIHFANHTFLELFGEPGRRMCFEVMGGRDEACEGCLMRSVVDDGEPRQWRWTDARDRTFQVWAYPFRGETGENLILEMGLDVSEHLRLQREVVGISDLERQRIGVDLHDSVGQVLTGVAMLSKVLGGKLGARELPEADSAAEISRLLNEAIRQTRFLARGLFPAHLKRLGLAAALEEFAANASDLYDVNCSFRTEGDPPDIPESTAAHLFRIAQEAVSNAVRHADADRIRIVLRARKDGAELTITNNGAPPPPRPDWRKGLGLRIMEYRASMIGGTLRIKPGADGGAVVSCRINGAPTETRGAEASHE